MLKIKQNYPLKKLCTLKIGGLAHFFTQVDSVTELKEALLFAENNKLKILTIGHGSNLLFDDQGFHGLIIKNNLQTLTINDNVISVGAGFSLCKLSAITAEHNLSGLEFAITIPATIGGAIYMNAAAHQQKMEDIVETVQFLHYNGTMLILKKADITFAYRFSSFQHMQGIILSATLTMKKSEDCKKKQQEIIAYRKTHQPLTQKSAGCIFKNPSNELSAGKLIDDCGLKGKRIGDALVSPIHANFIVNENNATSRDMLELITLVKNVVEEKTKIQLITEICYIPH